MQGGALATSYGAAHVHGLRELLTCMLHASVSASYERSRATRQAHMATRHLQKLRGEEVQPLDTQDSEASESEEACTGPLNPFDLLDDNEVR